MADNNLLNNYFATNNWMQNCFRRIHVQDPEDWKILYRSLSH